MQTMRRKYNQYKQLLLLILFLKNKQVEQMFNNTYINNQTTMVFAVNSIVFELKFEFPMVYFIYIYIYNTIVFDSILYFGLKVTNNTVLLKQKHVKQCQTQEPWENEKHIGREIRLS